MLSRTWPICRPPEPEARCDRGRRRRPGRRRHGVRGLEAPFELDAARLPAAVSPRPAAGQFGAPPSSNGYGRRFDGRPFDGRGFGLGRPGGSFTAAATYLGISQTQLFTDIRSGKTLAQIANSTSGKSASGLIDAMVAAEKTELDAAVKSGRITQAMADQIEANLKARVTQMVNNGFGRFGGRGGGNGFGSPPSTPPTLGGSSPL